MILLNDNQAAETVRIFAHGAYEASCHIQKIMSTGRNLFTLAGTKVTLGQAVKRRRKCIRVVKQALRGFIV